MAFTPVNETVAIRQTSSAVFAGVVCKNATINFEPFVNAEGVVEYVNPEDLTDNAAVQGGEYIFDESVEIKEIRGAAGVLDVRIADLDGSHEVIIDGALPAGYNKLQDVVVQRSQKLLISSASSGWIEVYVVNSIYN